MDTPRRTAAFFDLDKTVVARSSTLAFSRTLYSGGLLSPTTMLKVAYAQLVYQLFGADEGRMERSRAALLELTRGWEATRVQRLIRESLVEVISPLVYAEAVALLEEHRAAGRELYLVSSSSVEVVRPLADHLGVPHVIATVAGLDADGRYDGTLQFYAYADNKALAVREEARRRDLDLAGSYAYSDSVTDLPLLEAVGHPVAVNPDAKLRAVAAERGWEVRDFTRPVALRRLPALPALPRPVLAAGTALTAVALLGWAVQALRHRRVLARLEDVLA